MKTSIAVLSTVFGLVLGVSSFSVHAAEKASVTKRIPPIAAPSLLVPAQGHAKHVDFVALSNKRADLRASIASKGLNAAFTEWLRTEHAHIYRQHLEEMARANQKSDANKIAAR